EGEGLRALKSKVRATAAQVQEPTLAQTGQAAITAVNHAEQWLLNAMGAGRPAVEAGARRFALTLGRALELALLTEHAQWSLAVEKDGRALAAARRFAQAGIDLIGDTDRDEALALANDLPLPLV
ncbi:MAG: hypothetical protein KC449_27435, partial [Anaerolineales bacterium]|nr:hypothetical protein [Anaerolineales bacterium]